jgi:iron complex outermembrane recepter protein
MSAPQSSSPMAGHWGSIATVLAAWRFYLALCLVVCIVGISEAASPQVYDINLRAQSVADALASLSEQTGVPVVFPYDLVKDRKGNPVSGHYTLLEALNALLKDTGLSGGLSDKGVLTVSLAKPAASESGEALVTHDNTNQNTNNTRVSRQAGIAAFFASLAAAFSASAQDASDSNDDQTTMAKVVVTAEKHEERAQDTPVSLTVVDTEALSENGLSRLADYYATVPGLSLNSGVYPGGAQYLTIRGLSTGWNQTSTVAAVIDDVPTGSGNLSAGGSIAIPDLDPSDLARIEVLKGPQGTLYGADSLGGLLKYVTVDPSTSGFSGRIQVTGVDVPGGGLGYSVRAAVNIPVSDTFAIRASAFERHDPGYIDDLTSGQNNVNSADVYGGHLAALWRPSDDISLKVSALIQQTDANGSPYFNAQLSSTATLQPTLGYLKMTGEAFGNPYTRQEQLYSATLRAKVAGLDLVSVTGYSVNEYSLWNDFGTYFDAYFSSPVNFNVLGVGQQEHYDTQKFSQELRLSSSIGEWLDWLVGGFYTHENDANSYNMWSAANPATQTVGSLLLKTPYSPYSFSEEAFFADLTVHFTDRFKVQFGGRQSWNSQTYAPQAITGPAVIDFFGQPSPDPQAPERATGDAFTYLVTPQFTFSPDAMLYARVSSGYRIGGPNAGAAMYPGTPLDYKPDTTVNYEVGFKSDLLERRLSIDASVYYITWHDFPIHVLTYGGFDYFEINAGDAKSEGVEFSVQSRPAAGLTLAAQGSFNDATLTQNLPANAAYVYAVPGDRLPYSVRWSGGITANQDIRLSNGWTGFVGAEFYYVGLRYGEFTYASTAPRVQLPGYGLGNLRAGIRQESWLINLYVNNVSDKRGLVGYAPGIVATGNTGGYYGTVTQPRTIGLSVSRNF